VAGGGGWGEGEGGPRGPRISFWVLKKVRTIWVPLPLWDFYAGFEWIFKGDKKKW